MKIKFVFISTFFIPLFSYAQIKDKDIYSLLSSYFKDTNLVRGPYYIEKKSLAFKNNSIDYNEVLNKYFFEDTFSVEWERIKIDTILNAGDFNAMKRKTVSLPGRYDWNIKGLKKYGIPYGDTLSNANASYLLNNSMTIHRICIPLFSVNKKSALFYAEYLNEASGGQGNVYLYRRKKKEWKLLFMTNVWIE